MSFTAILLAGDRPDDPLAEIAPETRKALLPLGGRPMIAYVLKTLLGGAHIGEIVVVANGIKTIEDAVRPLLDERAAGRVQFCEGGVTARGVLRAVQELDLDGAVLVATADNPLLGIAALDDFCARAEVSGCDAVVGLAREADVRAMFPGAQRSFVKLKGGGYANCNLFALAPGSAATAALAWSVVEDKRTKPLSLLAHFGVFTVLKAALRLLSLEDAMAAATRSLGIRCGAVVLGDPLAAMHVGRFDHVAIAEAVQLHMP